MDNSIVNKTFFRDLFDSHTDLSGRKSYKTYVYVISKIFADGNEYFKVGEGNVNEKRLKSPMTYLAPPFDDLGYKIHLIIFYQSSPYKGEYAYAVEAYLHKRLQSVYKRVPHLTSAKPSEWFLVPSKKEKNFISFIRVEISKMLPLPLKVYAFKPNKLKAYPRTVNQKAKHTVSIINILKDAEDALKIKKSEILIKRGSTPYFTKKLMNVEFKESKKMWKVIQIQYNRSEQIYTVDYEPLKKTKNSNQEIQFASILKVLDWIGQKKRDDLDLNDNFEYWTEFDKLQNGD
jgi:hypothetical protein